MTFRQKLQRNKILKALASLKLTVLCLSLLFILTLWGTVGQVQNGLYLAQERFFHSFFFLAMGFLPFPGAQLVMWVLFVNLTAVALVRYAYTWNRIGILIIHGGLMLFLVSGYVTLHGAVESHLALGEGNAANYSTAFHSWDVAVWKDQETPATGKFVTDVTSVDIMAFKHDRPVVFEDQGITLRLLEYYRNCGAYTGGQTDITYRNASGIQRLEPRGLEKEPGENTPGAIFQAETTTGESFKLLLYGSDTAPTPIETKDGRYNLSLRLKHYPLPFTLKLVDFIMERHPGTDTARAYKSRVAIETNGAWREKVISMNNPLRYKNFTFYQSSYSIDKFNNETSILAVVHNAGQVLPYLATFITFAGLVIHFCMMASRSRKKHA